MRLELVVPWLPFVVPDLATAVPPVCAEDKADEKDDDDKDDDEEEEDDDELDDDELPEVTPPIETVDDFDEDDFDDDFDDDFEEEVEEDDEPGMNLGNAGSNDDFDD